MLTAEGPSQLVDWREAGIADMPLVYSSWLRSYRNAPAVEQVPSDVYFQEQHLVIDGLLCRPGSEILIACDRERPDDIWGYVVLETLDEGRLVHFTYVKAAFRRFGLASELWRQAGLSINQPQHTHDTIPGRHLAEKFHSSFNPYLAR